MRAPRGFTIWLPGHRRRSYSRMFPTDPRISKTNSSGQAPLVANAPRLADHVSNQGIFPFFLTTNISEWINTELTPYFAFSANTKRPPQTEALEERRLQILSLLYGKRSLKYLLDERNLKECGLLGETESTDDGPKCSGWREVPVPKSYI